MDNLKQVRGHGQSIWLDFLDRRVMDSGELERFIERDGISGLTSNPAIFAKAIGNSTDYDRDIALLAEKHGDNEDIFQEIAMGDIRRAADIFAPVYKGAKGRDGFVSLEVSPSLARDTAGTLAQAKKIWERVDRDNLMVKIPGTMEGLPGIRSCIRAGININVTLLFGLPRYREVTQAYLQGLEDRLNDGNPIDRVASVASFFLSRIDVMVDPMLGERGLDDMVGEVAIACAKGAHAIHKEVFNGDRFKRLEREGAQKQRLLWASTATKDPSFRDVKYMEALIGRGTVNTVTTETLDAFRDHGEVASTLDSGTDGAARTLERLRDHGINIDDIARDLELEGIDKFTKPYEKLLEKIGEQRPKS